LAEQDAAWTENGTTLRPLKIKGRQTKSPPSKADETTASEKLARCAARPRSAFRDWPTMRQSRVCRRKPFPSCYGRDGAQGVLLLSPSGLQCGHCGLDRTRFPSRSPAVHATQARAVRRREWERSRELSTSPFQTILGLPVISSQGRPKRH